MHDIFGQVIAEVSETAVQAESPELPLVQILWVLGIVFLGFFLMRRAWVRVKKSQQSRNLSVQERLERRMGKQQVHIEHMNELMAALADLSRQINGQIDTRLAKLEILLRQADQKIAQMGQMNGRGVTNNGQDVVAEDSGDESSMGQARGVLQEITTDIQEEIKAPQLSPEAREVRELVDQGISEVEIARKLDRPVGEIQLIISLSGKNKGPGGNCSRSQ